MYRHILFSYIFEREMKAASMAVLHKFSYTICVMRWYYEDDEACIPQCEKKL